MEKATGTENTIDVFENDIDMYLQMFKEEQNIEDLRSIPQSVWNGCLMYICRHLFKGTDLLKSKARRTVENNIIASNFNAYDYELVNKIADYYIYLCSLYNKEVSIVGFSNLTGITTETIYIWGSNNNYNNICNSVIDNNLDKLGSSSFDIYKKLIEKREESLSNKLADGKQNPVGVIAMLNRHYGWASPYTADANRQKRVSSDAELPVLGENKSSLPQIAENNE